MCIAPIGSPYYKDDTFNVTEREISKCIPLGKPVLLLGEFNARTSRLADYPVVDAETELLTDIDDEIFK